MPLASGSRLGSYEILAPIGAAGELDGKPRAITPDLFRPSAQPGRVDVVEIATGRRTTFKEFRPPDPAGVQQVGPMAIAPDGSSYVYSYRRELDELYLATGMR